MVRKENCTSFKGSLLKEKILIYNFFNETNFLHKFYNFRRKKYPYFPIRYTMYVIFEKKKKKNSRVLK